MVKRALITGMLIIGAVGCVVIGLVFASGESLRCVLRSEWQIAELDAGNEYHIRIFRECWPDEMRAISYDVVSEGDKIIPVTTFGFAALDVKEFKFEVVKSNSDQIVGVVESSEPRILLIIQDVKSGESWPYQSETESAKERRAKGARLMDYFGMNGHFLLSGRAVPGKKAKIY